MLSICVNRSYDAPLCTCAPGKIMQNGVCYEPKSLMGLRRHIAALEAKRYGQSNNLYPYLDTPESLARHAWVGEQMRNHQPTSVLDLGFGRHPILSFISFCPSLYVANEPVLRTTEWLQNITRRCPETNASTGLHAEKVSLAASEWNSPNNWDPGGVPTTSDNVVGLPDDPAFFATFFFEK